MLPSQLILPAVAVAVAVVGVGAAVPSLAAAPGTTTVTYNGPSHARAGGSYARVFLTDEPGTLTGFVVTTRAGDSRLRIRVADTTGRPVAVTVAWGEERWTSCDATDVRTPAFDGGTELYVEVLAGVCQDGSSGPTASVPTRGSITFSLQQSPG